MGRPFIAKSYVATLIAASLWSFSASADNLTLPETSRWIVVSSRFTLEEAKASAENYLTDKDGVRIVRAQNGRFAVVLGPVTRLDINAIKAEKSIPDDAYLAIGKSFIDTVWLPPIQEKVVERKVIEQPVVTYPDTRPCTSVNNNDDRLRCYDAAHGIRTRSSIVEVKTPVVDTQVVETPVTRKAAQHQYPAVAAGTVTPLDYTLEHLSENFEAGRLHDRIQMTMSFRNGTNKTVVGVRHQFSVSDAFGEVLLKGTDNLDVKMGPMTNIKSSMVYYWDDNPFIGKEPYDRLEAPLANGTYKITKKILKVIFEDGTSSEIAALD